MPFRFIILILVFSSTFYLSAQNSDSLMPKLSLEEIALVDQSDSYSTVPTDIGNIEPVICEANVNPSFVIRKRKHSKLLAILPPQIIIRRYNEYSYPVQTPS